MFYPTCNVPRPPPIHNPATGRPSRFRVNQLDMSPLPRTQTPHVELFPPYIQKFFLRGGDFLKRHLSELCFLLLRRKASNRFPQDHPPSSDCLERTDRTLPFRCVSYFPPFAPPRLPQVPSPPEVDLDARWPILCLHPPTSPSLEDAAL